MSLNASRTDTKRTTQMNSFVINNSSVCPTLTKYLGEFLFDIERQIGIEPKVCPIKMVSKRTYYD